MALIFAGKLTAGQRALRIAAAILAVFSALLIFAYNPLQDDVNGPVPTRWQNASVTWNLNPTISNNNVETSSGVDVGTAVTNGFNVWPQTQLNGQTLNGLSITRGPDSTLTNPNSSNCLNVVSFSPTSAVSFSTGTIAFTQLTSVTGTPPFAYTCTGTTSPKTCNLPSCLKDADVEFNPQEQFTTSPTPVANRFDVQSVTSHEAGHLLGLDHSGIARAVMYPFGDTRASSQQRNLAVDDVVGIAFLYSSSAFNTATGTISGKITLNGSGIFASHVVAVDATTGVAVIDGLTNTDGTYKLVGVPPGSYNILALPLAPDINSGVYTLSDFGGWSCGYGENSTPCCDPKTDPSCTGTLQNPTNYTGKFF